LQNEINRFAVKRFNNIDTQDYHSVKATIERLDKDARVMFGKDGKAFRVGMGHMGNGISVWNRIEECDGNYAAIAHIGADREP
jgi:hypothetical protein